MEKTKKSIEEYLNTFSVDYVNRLARLPIEIEFKDITEEDIIKMLDRKIEIQKEMLKNVP